MKNTSDTRCKTDAQADRRAYEITRSMPNQPGSATQQVIRATINDMRDTLAAAGMPLKHLDAITTDQVDKYVESVASKVETGDLAAKTAKDKITSLNNILRSDLVNKPDLVQSAKENGVTQKVDTSDKANSREAAEAFKQFLSEKAAQGNEVAKAAKLAVDNQLQNGLRLRESICMNYGNKNPNSDFLAVTKADRPKNNRPREVDVRTQEQKDAIAAARDFCKKNEQNNLIHPGKSYKQTEDAFKNLVKEFTEKTGMHFNYHGERHEFAHRLYEAKTKELCGIELKCKAQVCEERLPVDKQTDSKARQKCYNEYIKEQTGLTGWPARNLVNKAFDSVSNALGHGDGRADITRAYLG